MESVVSEMDLEEWELLPEGGYLEINDEDDGANNNKMMIYSSRNKVSSSSSYSASSYKYYTTSAFQMNYFICPAAARPDDDDDQFVDKSTVLPASNYDLQAAPTSLMMMINKEELIHQVPADGGASSQVFFKKIKETEFADIKVDSSSPRSMNKNPQSFDHHHHQENRSDLIQVLDDDDDDGNSNSNNNIIKRNEQSHDDYSSNIWKWSLTGIGAICSFGVAAICIITSANKHNQNLHYFQIYTNDRRMKQVVQHASKLNEAISALRGGVPVNRAHITFGGYYDASSSSP